MKNVACPKSKQRMLTEHPAGDSGRREAAYWPGITEMHIKGRISMSPVSCIFPLLSHFSRVWLFATLWTVACWACLSMGFSRQEYWSGCHALLQGIFLTQGSNPISFMYPELAGGIFTTSATWEAHRERERYVYIYICVCVCVCVCVYIYIYVHIYVCLCVYLYVYI